MRRLILIVLSLCITGFLLAITVTTLLASEPGRAWVRDKINESITSGIAGRLEVAEIEQISLSRVRARGVKIFAPDGKPAIEADRAKLDFSIREMLSGRYGWSRAEVEGCLVHVTEDDQGKINMEETFKGRPKPGESAAAKEKESDKKSKEESGSDIDMRSMVTSGCTLVIGGGSLPKLRMVDLKGIMRVHVLPSGSTELRFDEYSGTFEEGLPTGVLVFRDVAGEVKTGLDRLLHFDGRGKSEGEAVSFALDIFLKPKKRVVIEARFPELTMASISALGVAAFSKFSPTLDMKVHHGKEN
jgi:hypothetical protein